MQDRGGRRTVINAAAPADSDMIAETNFVFNKPYEKHTGTACHAPYVDISISALASRKSEKKRFRARIDTGADITCIPYKQAEALMPLLLGKPLLVRGHDGAVKRVKTARAPGVQSALRPGAAAIGMGEQRAVQGGRCRPWHISRRFLRASALCQDTVPVPVAIRAGRRYNRTHRIRGEMR